MMRVLGAALIAALVLITPARAIPPLGQQAPQFSATDSDGNLVTLSDFAGKVVVLEWTNHGCPFVRKHYDTGNLQALQREAWAAGAVWLSVISSAPGRQGFVDGGEANRLTAKRKAVPTAVILDPEGRLGRLYEATTTPQIFILDKDHRLVFAGAVDDQPSAKRQTVKGANNFVRQALADLAAGGPVGNATPRPYGCTIKYAP